MWRCVYVDDVQAVVNMNNEDQSLPGANNYNNSLGKARTAKYNLKKNGKTQK